MRRIFFFALLGLTAAAVQGGPWQRVISYGADLAPEERVAMVKDFALPAEVNPGQIPTVTVQHSEEVALLQRVAAPEVIGAKAVSSVYIEAVAAGGGLAVDTKNVTWVTPAIYANAMATGGVRDARAVVTSPVPVSGAAALAGIFKAYAMLSGADLPAAAREAAAEELVRTGELGRDLGAGRAARFVARVKEEVVRTRAGTVTAIGEVVERVAREEEVTLTDEQERNLTDVMIRLSKLDLSVQQLQAQLRNYTQEAPEPATGIGGLIARVIDFIQNLFKQLLGFVGKIFKR